MRLLRFELNGPYKSLPSFDVSFPDLGEPVAPIGLTGVNGSGKSQFIELIAEVFCCLDAHTLDYVNASSAERWADLDCAIEYQTSDGFQIRAVLAEGHVEMRRAGSEGVIDGAAYRDFLPHRVCAYSSGFNETLSLPFRYLEGQYAEEVRLSAMKGSGEARMSPRSLWLDLDANHRVLLSNLLLGGPSTKEWLRERAQVDSLRSFELRFNLKTQSGREIEFTADLEEAIDKLRRCSTDSDFDGVSGTFYYEVGSETQEAFAHYFDEDPAKLYDTLHRLALFNFLGLSKTDRNWWKAARLGTNSSSEYPTIPASQRVFSVSSVSITLTDGTTVPYAGLSDGEHQLLHVIGMTMLHSEPNILFLLDEPTTHWNPVWRGQFSEWLQDVASTACQEFMVATHSPQVASGLRGARMLVFERSEEEVSIDRAPLETYGASYDELVTRLFGAGAIASAPRLDMERLVQSEDASEIATAVERFGFSEEKQALYAALARLESED